MNKMIAITLIAVLAVVTARPQTFQATGTGSGFGTGGNPLFGKEAAPLLGGAGIIPAQPGAGQLAFPGFNFGTGSGAGAGTGNAGPGGVSASGVGIASAQDGGAATGTGTGTAALDLLTGQAAATGTGSGSSVGK